MANVNMFTPEKTVTLTAAPTASSAAIPTGSGPALFIQNAGASTAFFLLGTAGVVATAGVSGVWPLLATSSVIITFDNANQTHISTVSTAATVYVTRGAGIK